MPIYEFALRQMWRAARTVTLNVLFFNSVERVEFARRHGLLPRTFKTQLLAYNIKYGQAFSAIRMSGEWDKILAAL